MKQGEAIFSQVTQVPVDAIFGINDQFLSDARRDKINLTVGILVGEDGKVAEILPSVKLAEAEILRTSQTKNYLPIDGDPDYVGLTKALIFGPNPSALIYGAQTVGGTSALRILGDFIKREISDTIYLPEPTWENHGNIFKRAGLHVESYPYPEGMREHLKGIPDGSVVLLHASCHNPTGLDLSKEEWGEMEALFRKKRLMCLFDSAYQGFGGGLEADSFAIRLFVEQGQECLVAHSYSKSFSLYGERVGALYVVTKKEASVDLVRRNIRGLIRTDYSNPPRHGSAIVKLILHDSKLREMWEKELESVRLRLIAVRKSLQEKLEKEVKGRLFPQVTKGQGFFCLLGLSLEESEKLRREFGIYTAPKARVNLTALNSRNIDIVVDAIRRTL